jgi:DNA-binding NarL/FixJ family response regulator
LGATRSKRRNLVADGTRSSQDGPIKVIVCDDAEGADDDWASLVAYAAGDDGRPLKKVGEASTARGAISQGKIRSADVVLVDLVMPKVQSGKRVMAGPWIARALTRYYAAGNSPFKANPADSKDQRPLVPALILWTSNPLETVGCDVHAFVHLGGRHVVDKQATVKKQVELIRTVVASDERWAPQPDGLTPQLRKVLQMLDAGWSNREMADALFVEAKTIEGYSGDLRRSLGVAKNAAKGAGPVLAAAKAEGITWVPIRYLADPGEDPLSLAS